MAKARAKGKADEPAKESTGTGRTSAAKKMAKKRKVATKVAASTARGTTVRGTTRTTRTPTTKPTMRATPTNAPAEAEAKPARQSLTGKLARDKTGERQTIRCYLCGASFEVSAKTMSTPCSHCHKAIKVEDLQIKSYVPVNELQTCGQIKVTKRGRIAAKMIQSGRGIVCEGSMEGSVETDGTIELGPKAAWKGAMLQSRILAVAEGATLNGHVAVPGQRSEE